MALELRQQLTSCRVYIVERRIGFLVGVVAGHRMGLKSVSPIVIVGSLEPVVFGAVGSLRPLNREPMVH